MTTAHPFPGFQPFWTCDSLPWQTIGFGRDIGRLNAARVKIVNKGEEGNQFGS